MAISKTSQIIFDVSLDEQNIPEKISWLATDGEDRARECKSIMLSIWDHQEQNTLRIDLWTKEMRVDEMDQQFIQSMILMAESYQRATQNPFVIKEVQQFCESLVQKIEAFEKTKQSNN